MLVSTEIFQAVRTPKEGEDPDTFKVIPYYSEEEKKPEHDVTEPVYHKKSKNGAEAAAPAPAPAEEKKEEKKEEEKKIENPAAPATEAPAEAPTEAPAAPPA